jgi:hypothetical protein
MRLPLLQGSTGSPAAARRGTIAGANAVMSVTRSSLPFALDVLGAMVAARLFPDSTLRMGAIDIGDRLESLDLGLLHLSPKSAPTGRSLGEWFRAARKWVGATTARDHGVAANFARQLGVIARVTAIHNLPELDRQFRISKNS